MSSFRGVHYNSLSRLLTATNPESGTITYAYDADGNLVNKTSPAPNQTGTATVTLTYCYDALNRLTAKGASFSPNPPQSCSSGTLSAPIATYSYDQPACLLNASCANIGHRTGMVDAAGSESWSYDVMGRPTTVQRTTNGFTRNFLYAYNLDGSLASLTYPSAFPTDAWPSHTETMSFTQGGAGRPLSEESSSTAAAYNAHYEPNGSLCFMNSDWGNLFTHTYTFNNRFQPATMQVYGTGHGPTTPCTASTDTTADLDLTYTYTDANGHNNGNVMQIEDNVEWSRTQDFAYDSLNRISAAWTWGSPTNGAADCWAEQYGYDPWGNLLSIAAIAPTYTGCSQESGFNVTVTAKNQVSSNVYDAAGNLISIPGVASYTYDAENHLLTAGGVTYTYDGDGQRLVKSSGTTYWYGAGSDPLFETDSSGYQIYLHYYFNGQRIGRREAWAEGFWVDHYAYDALGNARFVYSFDGIDDESVYYPFGGERVISSGGKNQFKFTSKERDSESGLDNFETRYMNSSFGRFMSPDQSFVGWDQSNPQSFNLYAYVEDNPLNMTDPDGMTPCGQRPGSFEEQTSEGENSGSDCSGSGGDSTPPPAAKCGILCRIGKLLKGDSGKSDSTATPPPKGEAVPFVPSPPPASSPTPSAPHPAPHPVGPVGPTSKAGAIALPLVVCQVAEPCGAGVDTLVIGAALITAGVYAAKLTYNHFSSEQSLIRTIAREFGISATALGNAVHAWKRAHGMGPADNMTAEQLRELASEVKQGLWLGTE